MITKQDARYYFRNSSLEIAKNRPISALSYQKDLTRQFMFPPALRQYHMHVLGTPGGGKTRFLEACIRQDIEKEHGLIVFDPTGNLYNSLVKWCIQKGYLNSRKIILLNANDPEFTFGFNPLEVPETHHSSNRMKHGMIDRLVDATMRAIGAIQGDEKSEDKPRYDYIMRKILFCMAENGRTLCDGHVFTEFDHFLERESLHKASLSKEVRDAWASFELDGKKDRREYSTLMEAPRNRLGRFHSAVLGSIVGQPKSSIDLRRAMDDGAVVLVNLGVSGDGLTMEASTILGRLLLNNLALRARERSVKNNRPPRPFYCYIDECHRFMNDDMASSIDELRQNGLRMILSHQHIGQLREAGEKVTGSVLGSAQTKVYFKLSQEDSAEVAERVYAGRIDLEESLAKFDKPATVGHTIEHLKSYNTSETETNGESRTQSSGRNESRGSSDTHSIRYSADILSFRDLDGFGDSHGTSRSIGTSVLSAIAKSDTYARQIGEGVSETLVPELAWLPTTRLTFEEQLYKRRSYLSMMGQGRCVVALPHDISFDAQVKYVGDPVVTDAQHKQAEQTYYMSKPDAYMRKDDIYASLQSSPHDVDQEESDTEFGLS